jgi:molybdopterin converting factor small subunit
VRVRVLLFAGLAQRAGAREWTLDEVAAGATVGSLLERLRARHPFLSEVPFTIACDQRIVRADFELRDGAEVALLPPVSGG